MQTSVWQVTIGIAIAAVVLGSASFIAYLLYGPGITVTVPSFFSTTTVSAEKIPVTSPLDSSEQTSLELQIGTHFTCDDGKALKAEFLEASVRLALSDGRIVTLPRVVTDEGEIRYENADGNFRFRNIENEVFVEEAGVVTYASCTATAGE